MLNQERLRQRIRKEEVRKQLEMMKQFNSRASQFLRFLNSELRTKEALLKSLTADDYQDTTGHNLDIMTVDIGNTEILTQSGASNRHMNWEAQIDADLDRGIII